LPFLSIRHGAGSGLVQLLRRQRYAT
jgi:hypothetical protein